MTSQVTPNESKITRRYCTGRPTTCAGASLPANPRMIASSSGTVTRAACSTMTIALTITPTTIAAMEERFTAKVLSIFLRRRKRIVRAHHQLAQELIRRIHRGAGEEETALASVLLHEA